MQEKTSGRKPFSSVKRNKNIIIKITVIYFAFVAVLKLSAVFHGQLLWSDIALTFPFLILGLADICLLKNQIENWIS